MKPNESSPKEKGKRQSRDIQISTDLLFMLKFPFYIEVTTTYYLSRSQVVFSELYILITIVVISLVLLIVMHPLLVRCQYHK